MRRREFIAALGGAAAWPLAARAQQRMPIIGFLHQGVASTYPDLIAAFKRGLNDSGYFEGRNVVIDYRWAENHYDRLPSMAAELVQRDIAVLVAAYLPAALAAKGATTAIPIVFVSGTDPVESGLVASFNRPGANITGMSVFTNLLIAKRLELLREVVPGAP